MIKIEALTIKHLKNIVMLHLKNLPETQSSKIGYRYLYLLYKSLLDHPENNDVLGAFDKNELVGLVSVSFCLKQTQNTLAKDMIPYGYMEMIGAIFRFKVSLIKVFTQFIFEYKLTKVIKNKSPYITTLFVDKNFQRLGIGKQLIQMTLKKCKSKGYKNLYVDTEELNANAQKFYLKIGFNLLQSIINAKVYYKIIS